MQDHYCMPEMNPSPYREIGVAPAMEGAMVCRMVYPEVYYKLQPFIMSVCDQMNTYGYMMPTQDMVDQMSDNIYDDVCTMYPDMAEYAYNHEMKSSIETAQFGRDFRHEGRGRFRRRGLFRDIIDILLLNELFGRGRGIF